MPAKALPCASAVFAFALARVNDSPSHVYKDVTSVSPAVVADFVYSNKDAASAMCQPSNQI